MKLIITCSKCIFPELRKTSDRGILFSEQIVDVRDDGRYEITCENGHTSVTILQEQKFEILFDIGAHAILDDYYREAVSSFTSSLERFYEFYIKVISLKNKVSSEAYNQVWKMVRNHSERQFGAFTHLYLIENKKSPDILRDNSHKFRNDVIHKGKIPEKKEALEYGNTIFQLIDPVLQDLKARYNEYVHKIVSEHNRAIRLANPNKTCSSTMTSYTFINIVRVKSESDPKTLEEYLQNLEIKRAALKR